METFLRILKSLAFSLFLFFLLFIVYYKDELMAKYSIPEALIWVTVVSGALAVVYFSIGTYFKIHALEYEFTSIVNHTFRTPLTRVIWFSKELEKDLPTKERIGYLQNINNATNRVLDIVDLFAGIKDINNTSGYFFEATSLRDIVERTISKYRDDINKKGISLQVSTFRDIPLLTLDLKKITFVIDTLMENAILYTPNNGKIIIDSISNNKNLTIYVGDNGMGLNWFDKFRIFSRFYRSKKAVLMNPDGMGLKLYMSKIIIGRHKGKIYAKSKGVDMGTTFFVKLPFNHKKS